MYPKWGTIAQMYHERVMHGLLLKMNGMHGTHFNPAYLHLSTETLRQRQGVTTPTVN